MQHKITIALLASGLVCAAGATCQAAVFLSFSTDQATYTSSPGSAVPVKVFLQETTNGADTSILMSQGGLFSAGLKLVSSGTPPSQPAALASLADIIPNPEFTGGAIKNANPLTLLLADGIFAEPGPMGDLMPDGSRRVLLGTFNFKAGNVPGETTSFKVTDYDDFGISSDTLTWQGTVLDNSISTGQFSIIVVPEPGVAILAPILWLVCRRIRRHA